MRSVIAAALLAAAALARRDGESGSKHGEEQWIDIRGAHSDSIQVNFEEVDFAVVDYTTRVGRNDKPQLLISLQQSSDAVRSTSFTSFTACEDNSLGLYLTTYFKDEERNPTLEVTHGGVRS